MGGCWCWLLSGEVRNQEDTIKHLVANFEGGKQVAGENEGMGAVTVFPFNETVGRVKKKAGLRILPKASTHLKGEEKFMPTRCGGLARPITSPDCLSFASKEETKKGTRGLGGGGGGGRGGVRQSSYWAYSTGSSTGEK